MSGGHWDYRDHGVRDLVCDISYDTRKDSPKLSKAIKEVGKWLTDLIHELDYHYSGDTEIHDFSKTEDRYLKKLRDISGKY